MFYNPLGFGLYLTNPLGKFFKGSYPEVTVTEATEAATMQLIDALDLEPIVFKLTASEYGEVPEMTLAEADRAVVLYRQFLMLHLLYPTKALVPTRIIDAIWHAHILDTAKYREDCERIFGRFLDHFPYLGLRGEEDVRNWHAASDETRRLFLHHFGVTFSGPSAGMCNGGCDDGSECVSANERVRPRPNRELSV